MNVTEAYFPLGFILEQINFSFYIDRSMSPPKRVQHMGRKSEPET